MAAAVVGTSAIAKGASPNTVQSLTTVVNGVVAGGGTFVGTLTVTGVQAANGVLSAVGTIAGNLLNTIKGAVTAVPQQAVTVPLAVSGSCQILNLTLGPLDLDLLGLQVHLNQVVLNITAVPGAGNLLGNLLCAVANLLNGGGPLQNLLTSLAGLLNQILGAL